MEEAQRRTAVLLHGLMGHPVEMSLIERRLKNEGYEVENIGYPSMKQPLEKIVELIEKKFEEENEMEGQIDFVTHSMGGIVLRLYHQRYKMPSLGRVVMLAPPNRGSELVDFLKNLHLEKTLGSIFAGFDVGKFLGPAGLELGTDEESVPLRLPPIDFECGVIVGIKPAFGIVEKVFKGDCDGAVSAERAYVEGLTDYLEVDTDHLKILADKSVHDQIVYFLRNGRFKK